MTLPLERRAPAFVGGLATRGAAPALLLADAEVSYTDLAGLVSARQAELGSTRRLVLLTLTPDLESIVSYLACLAGGHPVLVTSPDATAGLTQVYDPDVLAGPLGLEVRRPGTAHDLHPSLAVLLSTSGSTGSPKLVRLSAANLQSNAEAIATSLGIRATDRAITSLPLHYCYGLSVLHSHLLRGAATILTSLSVVDGCFWDLFRRHSATTLAGVPHTFTLLERVGFEDMELPALRYVTQAGGRLAPDRVRALATLGRRRGWDFVVMYGQTEATARMAYLPSDLALANPGAIGIPVPGGELDLDAVEQDGTGELVYRGPNVMLGYATTAADLALGRTVEVLRTGDLARRTPDGLFEVVGRRSRFAKVFGLRIDLERVETTALDAGHDLACLARDDELVVLTCGSSDARQVVAGIAGIPAAGVRVVQVDELPRNASGKLDHERMRELAQPTPAPVAQPRSVRDVMATVLDRPDVRTDQSFVELGGDSLSYVEASVQLEELLGHLPAGWHQLTVAELDSVRQPRRGWVRSLDTSLILRAAAIVIIVAQHAAVFRVLGGAHLLLGVAGYNFARFQLTSASRRERTAKVLRSTARIVAPAVAAIGLTTLLIGRYDWRHLLLVHDLVSPGISMKDFWFIEILVQLVLVSALLLAVPAVDRWERRAPFLLPLSLLVIGLLARFGVIPALDGRARLYAPYAIAWLFLWGWAAAKATSRPQRALLSVVLVLSLPGFFMGQPWREAVVGGGLLLLLWVPAIPLPRVAARVVAVLAGASLYVYVTHTLVLSQTRAIPLLAFLAASFAVGIGYWQLWTRVSGRVGRVRSRKPAPRPAPVP